MEKVRELPLKIGRVWQYYADGSKEGPYILRELPGPEFCPGDYWFNRVHLYTIEGKWSHTACILNLSN